MPKLGSHQPAPPESLGDLLDAMCPDEGQERVSVENVLSKVGARSFPTVILVPCVVLVSPLSGIPLMPTLGGLIVLLITLQALIGRKHLWLPGFLSRRSVPSSRMSKAVSWLRKPAAFMDKHSHNRLRFLTSGPARLLAYLTTTLIAISWPPLELLPFVTSFSAGAVAMIMYGLMVRDGIYMVAGYVQATVLYLLLLLLWIGLV